MRFSQGNIILKEAAKTGDIDEEELKNTGVDGAIAASEGFVEGSVSRVITTMCSSGVFGEELMGANPSIVATLTVLVIEGAIHGYELSQGKITAEEYGNMMVDRLMVYLVALPTSALFLAILPSTQIAMLVGCMAGGMVACVGYMIAKNATMDFVDAGGFGAVIPVDAVSSFNVAKDAIASINMTENLSSFKDSVVSTASNGLIQVQSIIK